VFSLTLDIIDSKRIDYDIIDFKKIDLCFGYNNVELIKQNGCCLDSFDQNCF